MTHFCFQCWKEITEDRAVCPHCGADQLALSRESFVQKLIRALNHPEPETPVRAAYILGELGATEAIPALANLLRTSNDPYIAAACATALGKISGPDALAALESITNLRSQPLIVREAINDAIHNANRERNTARN